MAKSLNDARPVVCVLVDVRVPVVGDDQFGESNFLMKKLFVFAPASRSVDTKVNVALYVVNAMPLFVSTQYRLTVFEESKPEVRTFG